MAAKSRLGARRADYNIGYGRPPVASQFKRGVSGNPGGRLKSSRATVAVPAGPQVGDPMLDAVLLVMAEVVTYEVSPGRRRSMPRSEALVRELGDRAAYDPRSFKQLAEMYSRAQYLQGRLREAEERAEELRLQRALDADMRRRREEVRSEEARREKRRQQALRRRERAAKAAAEARELLRDEGANSLEGKAGEARDAGAGGEGPPSGVADQPGYGGWEDQRLGDRGSSPAVAIRAAVPERRDEASAQLSWPDVRRPAVDIERGEPRRVRRRGEPMIANTRLLTGSGYF